MIKDDKDAFLLALQLAVTLPEGQEEKMKALFQMVASLSERLTPEEIEECKAIVQKEVEEFGGKLH